MGWSTNEKYLVVEKQGSSQARSGRRQEKRESSAEARSLVESQVERYRN
jgi:hypothetical protein